MSWEEMGTQKYSCPCGRGHYAVTWLMDDWNRHDEQWTMECLQCSAIYDLYTYSTYRHGMSEAHHRWVLRELLEKLSALNTQLNQKQRDIAAYIKREYTEKWLGEFSGQKKKTVWSQITQDGKEYPSLSTFYHRVRSSGMAYVLCEYLDYRKLSTVTRILALKDTYLDDYTSEVHRMEDAIDALKKEMFRQRS
jgi:hypothetical protein